MKKITFTPRELRVLELRSEYPYKASLAEIAREFNVTKERVRQIESKARRKQRQSQQP